MKITKILSLAILSVFIFSSCSDKESLLPEAEQANALKSYNVKRDASGAYYLDYVLEENIKSEKIVSDGLKSNDFILFHSPFTSSKKTTQELLVDNNNLSISFKDTRTDKQSNINIEDDITSISNTSAKKKEMLKEYSISNTENNIYQLDFTVNKHVSVDFIFNSELKIYEIHLEKGKSNETKFSRSFTKEKGEVLKIDFVNHIKQNGSSNFAARTEEYIKRRKPRITVDNGESGENL